MVSDMVSRTSGWPLESGTIPSLLLTFYAIQISVLIERKLRTRERMEAVRSKFPQ